MTRMKVYMITNKNEIFVVIFVAINSDATIYPATFGVWNASFHITILFFVFSYWKRAAVIVLASEGAIFFMVSLFLLRTMSRCAFSSARGTLVRSLVEFYEFIYRICVGCVACWNSFRSSIQHSTAWELSECWIWYILLIVVILLMILMANLKAVCELIRSDSHIRDWAGVLHWP